MKVDPRNTFVFSDPHFDHTNIIRYCQRPFKTTEHMNRAILANYNRRVKHDSLVFFLGDMVFGRNSRPYAYWLYRLKGNIIRFRGNHDKAGYKEMVIQADDIYLKLSHFPTNRGHWTGWMIHGHVHEKRPFINYQAKMVNVSLDVTDFKPVKLSEIIKRIR